MTANQFRTFLAAWLVCVALIGAAPYAIPQIATVYVPTSVLVPCVQEGSDNPVMVGSGQVFTVVESGGGLVIISGNGQQAIVKGTVATFREAELKARREWYPAANSTEPTNTAE